MKVPLHYHLYHIMWPLGRVTNAELYRMWRIYAKRNRIPLTEHWRATVRNTLQRYSKGNPKCKRGHARFTHVERGVWEVR